MLANSIIILILGLFTVIGFKKGVIEQAVSFVGMLLVYIIAFFLKNPVADIFYRYFPFLDFVGDLKGLVVLNVIVYQLLAFIIVAFILFVIYNIIIKVTGVVQKLVDLTVILTLPSKIIGGILGFFEGYFIIFIVLMLFAIPLAPIGINESPVAHHIMYNSPILSKSFGGVCDAVKDIFTLVEEGSDKDISKNKMNLDAMDKLLKYKVIDPESVDILIDNKKLNSVSGLGSIVDKYREDD